ncbi:MULTISPECIES: HepT-like ribonuclease domain-containing protein [Paraburkholderia]|uniref:HepT-like ribonuclease domain-containing protein n=1 Tax=Paraburkholderia TaxID=1822464 RepID=UPI0034629452
MPTPSERCGHIYYAIDAILRDVNGHGEQAFVADLTLRSACYYRFIVIGEAGDSLLRSSAQLIAQHAPNLTQSLSFAHRLRTILAHQYHRADPKIVWDTIQKDLPQLSADIANLRAALP